MRECKVQRRVISAVRLDVAVVEDDALVQGDALETFETRCQSFRIVDE